MEVAPSDGPREDDFPEAGRESDLQDAVVEDGPRENQAQEFEEGLESVVFVGISHGWQGEQRREVVEEVEVALREGLLHELVVLERGAQAGALLVVEVELEQRLLKTGTFCETK